MFSKRPSPGQHEGAGETQRGYIAPITAAVGGGVAAYVQDVYCMNNCLQTGLGQRDGRGRQGQSIFFFLLQQPDGSQMVDLNSFNRTMSLKPNSQCLGNDIVESLPPPWQVNMKVQAVND